MIKYKNLKIQYSIQIHQVHLAILTKILENQVQLVTLHTNHATDTIHLAILILRVTMGGISVISFMWMIAISVLLHEILI